METKASENPKESIPFDKTGVPRRPIHYFAQWLSIGWLFFYLVLPVLLIVLYKLSIVAFTVVLGTIVLSAIYPISHSTQPEWGWKLGRWCVQIAAEYFHIKFVVEDLDAVNSSGPAIFAMEPHDVLPISIFGFHSCLKPLAGHNCFGCVTSACFKMPIIRHMYTWFHTLSADKETIETNLQMGNSIVLIPGGVAEVTYLPESKRKKECVLYLSSRLGFVKLAMKNKVPVIPVFCFGLQNTFTYWVPENKFIHDLGRSIGFLPMVFKGMWGTPFGPARPCDYVIVVGSPIPFPDSFRIDSDDANGPTQEQVVEYHAKYIEALTNLYEKHKSSYGMANISLKIV